MTKLAYSAAEAAAMLGLHENTVRRMVANGTIKRIPNTGRVIRISAAELENVFGIVVGGAA